MDQKLRADTNCTLNPKLRSHGIENTLCDTHTNTAALNLLYILVLRALKRLKHLILDKLLCHADTCILHNNVKDCIIFIITAFLDSRTDTSKRFCILDTVADHIHQDLSEPHHVPHKIYMFCLTCHFQLNLASPRHL